MNVEVTANGKTICVSEYHKDYRLSGDIDSPCVILSSKLRAIAVALNELGEPEVAEYIKSKKDIELSRWFSYDSDNYKERDWTIRDAEKEFSRWCKNNREITLSDFAGCNDYDDDFFEDNDYILREIDKRIGWRSNWDGMDPQHMRVGLECRWGQIRPSWCMIFRNPDYLHYKLDIDKIRERFEAELAKRREYNAKLEALNEEYGY